MDWKQFNDLVGKNKPWGRQEDLLLWQQSVYQRAYNMLRRCYKSNNSDYKTYGAIGIKCEFTSLSEYYNTLKKDPLWQQFKAHPERYDIDKDIKCGHGNYTPSTIKIVPKVDNHREMLLRTNSSDRLREYNKRSVELDGVTYTSVTEASRLTGINPGNISLHAASRISVDKKNGRVINYSHTWTDKNGITHTARYI